jgi:phospholipid/cholesterol/gamma-HCH transport system ATP-binding protein
MSIGENVAMGLRKQGLLDAAGIRARVAEALDLVDLPNVADRFPAELSGGMRKRVGLARAIALRPKYLLYDEPTTGLDPVTSAVIDELMIRMREKLGVTSIVITHDMRSAYRVGTSIAMLYNGKVRQCGTVDEIRLSDDPVVRQFVEGGPTSTSAPSPDHGSPQGAARDLGRRRRHARRRRRTALPPDPRQLRQLGLPKDTSRRRTARGRGAT